ncbi:MAG: hypothetical protein LBC89_02185 [Bacteroidales bacterium]|jgi:hypothetical protein|nr:hypothetical protein [Bacteroidales bacterium]
MKKVILLAIIAAMLMAFTSCQKDGVYNPSKKISKIYYQSGSSTKYLVERWTWDGKKLQKITDANGNLSSSFTYNGNRLSKVTGSDGETYSFTYSGNDIKSIETKQEGKILSTINFTCKSGKVTKCEVHFYMNNRSNSTNFTTFNRLFPEISEDFQNLRNRSTADVYVVYNFSYDGGNLSKYTRIWSQGAETHESERMYKHDKKTNPYYNFIDGNFMFISQSKNNLVKEELLEDGHIYTWEYSYVYDGNYPTEQTTLYNGSLTTRWYEYE